MRMSLELVVVAIVLLVVALVVLTIFGSVIPRFGTMTDFSNYCASTGRLSCEAAGMEPINWKLDENVGGQMTTCLNAMGPFSGCCVDRTGVC